MTILHLIFSFDLGGAETILVDIANRQSLNNNVYVYIINDKYDAKLLNKFNNKVKVHLFKRKVGSRNLFKIFEINGKVLMLNPDIIHCHDSNITDLLFISRFFKTILTVHGIDLTLDGIKKYNRVIAISSAVKDNLLRRGCNKVSVVYNGIDMSAIQPKTYQQYNLPFKMIQVGRLDCSIKGQHILLEALQQLIIKYGITDFHIDFIGEGASFSYLKDLVLKYNLADKVSFLGLKDRSYIYSHLKEYDLLIQPSLFEGFGLTVTEGMAAMLPVLVSANDGPIEIIKNGEYGFFFKKGDSLDCAGEIKKIIESPDAAYKIAIKGYRYAIENFNIDNTVKSYQKEYDIVASIINK